MYASCADLANDSAVCPGSLAGERHGSGGSARLLRLCGAAGGGVLAAVLKDAARPPRRGRKQGAFVALFHPPLLSVLLLSVLACIPADLSMPFAPRIILMSSVRKV